MTAFFVRRRQSTSLSVTGELLYCGAHFCFTLEPAYGLAGVKPRAIPAGTYPLDIRFSPRFNRDMPHVEQVPDFTEIMLHPGNFPRDTDGCCLVGTTLGINFVGESDAAFAPLYANIETALASGPQTITFADPVAGQASDLDGQVGIG